MTLEPHGAHETPTGRVAYAIWHWTDADGVTMIPCAGVAALARSKSPRHATCGDRPLLRVRGKSAPALRRILSREGLVDADGRLTEKGSVVGFFFRRRSGVVAGYETAHFLGVPF